MAQPIIPVIFLILETLLKIAPDDVRGREYSAVIGLIHRCFFFFQVIGDDLLCFIDLVCQFNIELVGACRELYHRIKHEAQPDCNDACYWLAAIHSILLEPIEEVEDLMHASSDFAENLFSIIEEDNRMYFNYIQHAYASVMNLDDEDIAVKLRHFQLLRDRFFANTMDYEKVANGIML